MGNQVAFWIALTSCWHNIWSSPFCNTQHSSATLPLSVYPSGQIRDALRVRAGLAGL